MVARDRGDGTFDIEYDDGEEEASVAGSNIRAVPVVSSSAPKPPKGKFSAGTSVEANYRGGGKYYPARIKREKGGGRFHVAYEDGESESDVDEEHIRLVGYAHTATALSEGDIVECNYRMAGKWYPGRIEAVQPGGYDIVYDDGERESQVPIEAITLVQAAIAAVQPRSAAAAKPVETNLDNFLDGISDDEDDDPLPAIGAVEGTYEGNGYVAHTGAANESFDDGVMGGVDGGVFMTVGTADNSFIAADGCEGEEDGGDYDDDFDP